MKKLLIQSFFALFVATTWTTIVCAQSDFGQDRAGTEGYQFTKIAVDPRSAAMGNSNMADAIDGSSLYWNPALAARVESSTFMATHTSYLVDVNLDYISYIHRFSNFAIGGSVQYLNSGDIEETTVFQPFGTGRTFRTQHIAAGLSGAHKVTELFSYGITLKYLVEQIEEIRYQSAGIDFGFSYLVGTTGLRFAVGINNFGFDGSPTGTTVNQTLDGDVELEPTESISLPTRFHVGAAYDVIRDDQNSVIVTAQITNPSDNSEQFNIGAEYGYMNQFFVRTGYEFGHEERVLPSFGAGFALPSVRNFRVDYAYTAFDILGDIHRIGLSISL